MDIFWMRMGILFSVLLAHGVIRVVAGAWNPKSKFDTLVEAMQRGEAAAHLRKPRKETIMSVFRGIGPR